MTIIYDGEKYQSMDEIPDLGSWEATSVESGTNKRDYVGLATDVSKLPTYDDLASGSTALCVDTGELYIYKNGNKTWYAL